MVKHPALADLAVVDQLIGRYLEERNELIQKLAHLNAQEYKDVEHLLNEELKAA